MIRTSEPQQPRHSADIDVLGDSRRGWIRIDVNKNEFETCFLVVYAAHRFDDGEIVDGCYEHLSEAIASALDEARRRGCRFIPATVESAQ